MAAIAPTASVDAVRGDLVQVDWIDIFEDSVGDPDTATLARRSSIGFFWERKDDGDVPCIVTTTTMDKGDHSVSGYCIYPVSCVSRLRIIKKARRRRSAKETSSRGANTGT